MANGKKIIGAILIFITNILWLLIAYILTIPMSNTYKVLFFALGSSIGSYIGSILEEKLAIGNNLISIMTPNKNILNILNNIKIPYHIVNIGDEINIDIIVSRKKRDKIISYIRQYDKDALIIFQKILLSDSH